MNGIAFPLGPTGASPRSTRWVAATSWSASRHASDCDQRGSPPVQRGLLWRASARAGPCRVFYWSSPSRNAPFQLRALKEPPPSASPFAQRRFFARHGVGHGARGVQHRYPGCDQRRRLGECHGFRWTRTCREVSGEAEGHRQLTPSRRDPAICDRRFLLGTTSRPSAGAARHGGPEAPADLPCGLRSHLQSRAAPQRRRWLDP